MAKSPKYKVYDSNDQYQAAVKELMAGASLLANVYPNGSIRLGHLKSKTLYTDGIDGSAVNSYDMAVSICLDRLAGEDRELCSHCEEEFYPCHCWRDE